ncbi:MAG: acyltransferase family protein, partial [Acidobacteria bacterium]|nr:acyltransferase family protein [Acidobacteriota bacterium]
MRIEAATRYHGLDGLRAWMMLAGIWLHTVVGFSRDGGWPYKDPHPTDVYDFTLGIIHAFRMPAFYVMAGFFGALLYYRRGARGFLANRAARVLVPFLVCWTFLFALVGTLYAYAMHAGQRGTWSRVAAWMISPAPLKLAHPMHLWFLEYLLFLYVLLLAGAWLAPRLAPEAVLGAVNRGFRAVAGSVWAPAIFALPMFGLLLLTKNGHLEDPPGFAPVVRILLPYVLTVTFGWLLYLNSDLLENFRRNGGRHLAGALVFLLAWEFALQDLSRARGIEKAARAGAVALFMWLMIYGLTGVFLRYLDRPSARMRYLSDSSYWLYVFHMPVVMVYQIGLRPVPWPSALKVWIVLALAVPTLLASYHWGV